MKKFGICFILSLFPASIFAETMVLQNGLDGYTGTSDTSIFADNPNNSNGSGVFLYAGATSSSVRRTLIKFDLSAVPEMVVITRVELQLGFNRVGTNATNSDTYTLHRLTQDWGEAGSNSGDPGGNGTLAQAGDATWIANFHEQSQWNNPGGDYVETASVTTEISNQPPETVSISSEAMIEDVQAWLQTPDSNFGWILIGAEDSRNSARRFYSSESEIDPPQLIIDYEIQTGLNAWQLY